MKDDDRLTWAARWESNREGTVYLVDFDRDGFENFLGSSPWIEPSAEDAHLGTRFRRLTGTP